MRAEGPSAAAAATPTPAEISARTATTTLAVAVLAMGAALLIPTLFSDPNGVDPHAVRLAGVAAALAIAAFAVPRLRPRRGILLGVAAVAIPFSVWSATPQIIEFVAGTATPSGWAQEFFASLVEVIVTVALCVMALRTRVISLRDLRLRPTAVGVIVGVAGIALFVIVTLAIPAQVLGRLGFQPLAFSRDASWLIPADLLLGAVQELQFRGLLLAVLEKSMSQRRANVAQALIFGLGHLAVVYQGPEAPFVPLTVVLGLVLGYMTQRTRSLLPALMTHAVADVLVDVFVMSGLYGF